MHIEINILIKIKRYEKFFIKGYLPTELCLFSCNVHSFFNNF